MSFAYGPKPSFDVTNVLFEPIRFNFGSLDFYTAIKNQCIKRFSAKYDRKNNVYLYLKTFKGIRSNLNYIESNVLDVSDVNNRKTLHGQEIVDAPAPTEFSLDEIFKLVITNPMNNTVYFADVMFYKFERIAETMSYGLKYQKQLRIYRYGILGLNNEVKVIKATLNMRRNVQ